MAGIVGKNGINRVDGLYVPFTEGSRPDGPKGGFAAIMEYWPFGYTTWDGAVAALAAGPGAPPGLGAVPVDRSSGRPG